VPDVGSSSSRRAAEVPGRVTRQGSRKGGSGVFKRVRRRVPLGGNVGVGKVGDGFSDGAEVGWRIFPAHRKDEWEGHQRFLPRERGEGNTQDRYILGTEPHAVEAVGEVDLEHVHGAVLGGSEPDLAQQAMEGATKLHGVLWAERKRLRVDTGGGVVDDGAGSPLTLGNDAGGGETKAFEEATDKAVGEDGPVAKTSHLGHLVAKELIVLEGGGMTPCLHGLVAHVEAPRGGGGEDWSALVV